jgi:rhodanese-related sulfurtransferase
MYGFKEMDALELHGLLQADATQIDLIDVRTPAEVARGGIPGARNIPLHQVPLVEAELENARALVFYCQTGARSAQACAYLAARGFDSLYNLRGGILGWLRSGHPAADIAAATAAQADRV